MEAVVYRKKAGIISRKIAGEVFLVPVKGKLADMRHIFTLNPVAEFIWDSLDGRCSLQEILKDILSEFDVEEMQAETDLADFVKALRQADLLEKVL